MSSFAEAAARAPHDLHVALENWFNARGSEDPATVTDHFDAGFRLISPTGKVVANPGFVGAVPGMRGSRPGLKMEIADVDVRWASDDAAVVVYEETQTQGETRTVRLSTVLLVRDPSRAAPQWRHLQETWKA